MSLIIFSANFFIQSLLFQIPLLLVFSACDNEKLQKCYVELTKYMLNRHLQLCNVFLNESNFFVK